MRVRTRGLPLRLTLLLTLLLAPLASLRPLVAIVAASAGGGAKVSAIGTHPSVGRGTGQLVAGHMVPGHTAPPSQAQWAAISAAYGRLPLRFELNEGQTDHRVKFLARTGGSTLFLTNADAVLSVAQLQQQSRTLAQSPVHDLARLSGAPQAHNLLVGALRRSRDLLSDPLRRLQRPQRLKVSAIKLHFVGANPHPQVIGLDRLPGVSNYFIGKDRRKWRTDVPSYAKVEYKDVYPGISLIYYGRNGHIEYDWQVAPGANANAIQLAVEGTRRIRLDAKGDLVFQTGATFIRQILPVAYQMIGHRRHMVSARYVLSNAGRIRLSIGSHTSRAPLVIDPVLSYSTYLGGTYDDDGYGIAVDGAGNAYITGRTASQNFPLTPGAYSTAITGLFDVFVTKLNAAGNALMYSTYIGGSDYDAGFGITVDAAGNAYVVGATVSSDFPVVHAVQATTTNGNNNALDDAFVAELNASGTSLIYSTYLGGSRFDVGWGIDVDSAGNAYVTGYTDSTDFPTANALQPTFGGGQYDGFVAKLSTGGRSLLYSTYLGGAGEDQGFSIAADSAGDAYITGDTYSSNFPTASALQAAPSGNNDAFVVKLNPAGSTLLYATYLGGSGFDTGNGIAIDSVDNAYIAGETSSTDFPTAHALQRASGGDNDAFIAKLNPTGSTLTYATYLGGSGSDIGTAIAVDSAGNVFVAGTAGSANFPVANATQRTFGGTNDGFVAKLAVDGQELAYSTYLGGNGDDAAMGIAVDGGGSAYIAGIMKSTDFPTVNALQGSLNGNDDAFAATINPYGGPGRQEIGSPSEKDTTCSLAETVSCATGDFWRTFNDLSVPGRGLPLDFTRTYNSAIAAQNGPLGYGWTDNYDMFLTADSSGNVGVNEEVGTTVVFSPTTGGTYVAPSRVLATLADNGDGTLTFTRQADQIKYTFTAPTTTTVGQLVSETDRNGNTTTFSYDPTTHLLSSVTDQAGRSLAFYYDTSGHISSVLDPAGRTAAFYYDADGNLQSVIDVAGHATSFSYYPGTHLLWTMTGPLGGILTNTYDANGRVVQQTDPLNRATSFGYTPDGTTIITDTLGNVMTAHYENNVLLSETKGVGTSQQATWGYSYDPATLGLTSAIDPNGHVTRNTWDARGNLLSHTDALGRTTSYAYDALNDTTAITDPLGVTTAMTYDAGGNLLQVSRPLTQTGQVATTTYTYDATAGRHGDLLTKTDPDGHVSHYAYDQYGGLVSASDPQGNTTTARYDVVGRMTSMVSPNGDVTGANPISYTTTMTEDAFGQTTAITDPLGYAVIYQYDADQNLVAATDQNSHTTRYGYDLDDEQTVITRTDGTALTTSYDGDGSVLAQSDALNRATSYRYDPLNQLVSVTDPLNRVTQYGYDGAGNVITATDPLSRATVLAYDAAGEVISTTRPDDGVLRRAYDADGRLVSATDARNNTTTYGYDSLGRLTAVTDPLKRVTTYGYDLASNRTSVTDPLTHTTTYQYDAADEPITTTQADGSVLLTGYDADDNPVSQTDPRGYVTRSAYDALDRLISVTDPLSGTTSYQYDPAGNQTVVTDPLGHTTTDQYDAMNRVITVTDPLSQTTVYTYDPLGNRTAVTDPLSQTTGYTYDGDNEVTRVQRADGTAATTGYDDAGNVISQTDALGHATTYGYDSLDRVITATDPLARSTTYAYDGNGNRTALTDPQGRVTSYAYDADNELTGVTYSMTSTPKVTYTYTATGKRKTMKDGTGTSSYSYDALDRVITSTNGAGASVGYGYDPSGNVTTLRYPDSSVITRTYDQLNRVTSLKDWAGRTTTFGYDAASNLITTTLPNTTTVVRGYDQDNRLLGLTDKVGSSTRWSFGYGRDNGGKLSSSSDPISTTNHTYSYDPLNRLTKDAETGAGAGTTQWGYDAAHELTAITDTLKGTSALGYDAAGALTGLTTVTGTATTRNLTLSSDAEGDRTGQTDGVSGKSQNYSYDQASRLITATVGVTTSTYKYNGDGLRASKTVSGTTTAETWDVAEGTPELLRDGSSTKYVWGPDGLPLEQVTGSGAGTPTYYYQDVQGSTRGLLDGSGTTKATYTYDAYGTLLAKTGTVTQPFGYGGQYTDAETGFQYLRARYYDPATAGFLTRDPLLALTAQPYAYASGDPLDLGDPLGLCGIGPVSLPIGMSGSCLDQVAAHVGHFIDDGSGRDPMQRLAAYTASSGRAYYQSHPEAYAGPIGRTAGGATGAVRGAIQSNPGLDQALHAPVQPGANAWVGQAVDAANWAFTAASLFDGEGELALGARALAGAGETSGAETSALARGVEDVAGTSGADTAADQAALNEAERTPASDAEAGVEGCSCFPAQTEVATPHGEQAIAALHVGDMVQAEDAHTGAVRGERIARVIDDGDKPLMAVALSDGSAITVTANHPFYVDSGAALARAGWLQAGSLRVGDHLRTASGTDVLVVGLRQNVGHAEVYTLTVAHDHTFFVGSARMLVHNAKCPSSLKELVEHYSPSNYAFRGQRYYFSNLNPEKAALLKGKYENGVSFSELGFPDFSEYAYQTPNGPAITRIKMAGDSTDFQTADEAMGWGKTDRPYGWTWHHVEDRTTMILVPTDLHSSVGHYGGEWVIKHLGALP